MEAELEREKVQRARMNARAKYRKNHKSEFASRLEEEAYKKLVIRLLHKCLLKIPPAVLYSNQHPKLSTNQRKIYNTAISNFMQIPGLSNTHHLHGLTMQIVKFFDEILN